MNKVLTLISLAAALPFAACGTTTDDDLSIDNSSNVCVVQYADERVSTNLEPPCIFVKDKNGKIRSHTYHQARATVFIIMGKPEGSTSECSYQSQWFVLGDEMVVPDHIRDVEVCATSGGDEIAYRDVFHYIPGGLEILKSMPAGEYD
ncbi:hypothetical protein ACNKU7_14560 [Microbulbifer sp. SA54]|uniref:hypothetical protein n=1 Tax=Microbulbifer sp. SA54 TaxID=3401577 RepID=UPI003AAE28B2